MLLRGTNLTDEEARNHVSFLKDLVPMPGRDLSLSVHRGGRRRPQKEEGDTSRPPLLSWDRADLGRRGMLHCRA